MRPLAGTLLLTSVLLAGCAQEPAPTAEAATDASAQARSCTTGRVMTGIDAGGEPLCREPRHHGFTCDQGSAVVGFDLDGVPKCAPFVPAEPVRETYEVASNLRVVNIYGERNDTTTSLIHKLKVYLTLSAGAPALDTTTLILRYSDGTATFSDGHGFDGARGFNATWLRGDGSDGVMQSGDLVELELHLWAAGSGLAPRTSVSLSVIPEAGSPIAADFKTPTTYGTDKYITLR